MDTCTLLFAVMWGWVGDEWELYLVDTPLSRTRCAAQMPTVPFASPSKTQSKMISNTPGRRILHPRGQLSFNSSAPPDPLQTAKLACAAGLCDAIHSEFII